VLRWADNNLLDLKWEEIGEHYGRYRLHVPEAERAMARSLERYGQLSPVVVCRRQDRYELIDGFKRLGAVRGLAQIPRLSARLMEADERTAKAAIYGLNRAGGRTRELEEAWIIQALVREDGLSQVEVAELLGRHKSWVCRRLALIRNDDPSPDREASLKRRQRWQRDVLDGAALHVPEMAGAPAWIAQLLLAADSFLIARPLPGQPNGKSVIAGYPWFSDWGRDTMISLPGLTLATGRREWGRDILLTFARFVDRGMLPNVFPGAGDKPEYNTVDASLWFFEAWRAYLEASGDRESLAQVFLTLAGIVDSHLQGTRYGIHVDPKDALVIAGEPGVQLTWMDAKVGDWVVTPRIGKPVEINALWYNALCVMTAFAEALGRPAELYRSLADRVRVSFARFADEHTGGLYDVLDGPLGDDGPVRPNQIFAVSLPHSPLPPTTQAQVVALVGRRLLTSYGLRSLSADHPDYKPHYTGDPWHRDGAYHQGTVWAWLLGHYALAEYRVHGDADSALERIAAMRDHLFDAGLGTISEIFEAESPHFPSGTPSQAWSVACVLEAWWRIKRAIAVSKR